MADVEVKICGVSTQSIAEQAVAQGADYIGLVLAESPRRVTLAQAGQMTRALPAVRFVAVVKLMGQEDLQRLLDRADVWAVQYHGAADFDWIGLVRAAGRRAIATRASEAADIVLADGPEPGQGKPWQWRRPHLSCPVWIAGGLSPENVGQVVKALAPDGVDVSSGVETGGVKDIAKITKFIKEAKQWQS